MAVDGGYGLKGYPKFDPNGAHQDWVDLEAVGVFAAKVGNRAVGTAAQRAALSTSTTAADQMWDGLEFYETDTRYTYLREAGAWRLWMSPGVIVGAASGSRPRAQYRMHAGWVEIVGVQAKPGATYALFTLPAGFRPSGDHVYMDASTTDPLRQIKVYGVGAVEYSHLDAHDVTYQIKFPAVA